MLLAISNNALVSSSAPAGEIVLLQLSVHLISFLMAELSVVLPSTHHPLQPAVAARMDEEIKQTSKADAHNRVNRSAVLIPLMNEFMLEKRSDLEASGVERVMLCVIVRGVDGIQVDLGEVAVEVAADDLTAGVEAIAIHAVLQLTLVRGFAVLGLEGDSKVALGGFATLLGVDLQEGTLSGLASQDVYVCSGNGLRHVLDGTLTRLELQSNGILHGGVIGFGVVAPGMVCHPEGLFPRIDPPVTVLVLGI